MWTLTPYNPKDDPLGRYTQLKLNGKLIAKLLDHTLIVVDNDAKELAYFVNLIRNNKQPEASP